MRYSDQIDYIVSSVIYLGTHPHYWARSPSSMAKELSLNEARLQRVFENFPRLYRESKRKSPTGEHYYALQARYVQREGGDTADPEEVSFIDPLTTERLKLIIDFIQRAAEAERSGRRSWITNSISVAAAIIAAAAAIFVSFIK